MKHDRRPPGSRSPFEFTGNARRKRDLAKATNAATTTVEEGRSPRNRSGEYLSAMEKSITEVFAMPSEFMVSIGGHEFPVTNFQIGGSARSASAARDSQRERLEAEEQRLRGPIAKWLLSASPGLTWDDVIGNDTARRHLVEAIEDPIRHADLYRHYGKKPTKGLLLYGPPGCGKTMFGKAAASVLAQLHGTKSASFMSIKAPELQSIYIGATEERIRAIFAYARAYKALRGHPLVVFIDEADAILPSRDGAGGRQIHGYEESQVATFLTEMDGIAESGALVILATNRPDAIDAAVLRDGRIDRKIRIERPDRAAAAMIVQRALLNVPIAATTLASYDEPPLGEMSGTGEPYRPTALEHALGELALATTQAIYAPEQIVAELKTNAGARHVRLSDIVSGAMLVGLVEQAKGNAFRRDLAAGGTPSGITGEDLMLAVDAVLQQNRGLNHMAAIQEIGAREGFTYAHVVPQTSTPLRYTLDGAGDVVQLQ